MIKKIFVGTFAGIISGLFAAGGGMIVVPVLVHMFKLSEKQARATSIFCILPLVAISCAFYIKNQYIDWNIGIRCAIGGIMGSIIGSILLKKINNNFLTIIFTIFLFYMSIRMVIS